MLAQTIVAIILILGGVFFLTVSALGLLRLPDFFARTHAVGKSETLGSILMLSGLAVYNGWELTTIKILFIAFFVLIANPTATHAVARAALRTGLPPWTRKKPNDEDKKE
ncbi:MAG: monovalent cation/H(+) antiporter subunit G [Dehalococcoidales bacterium]